MLQTCSCAARIRSDHCRSIRVSIILCLLSVDSFFAVSVASAVNGSILCYSEYTFFMEFTLTFRKIIIRHKI